MKRTSPSLILGPLHSLVILASPLPFRSATSVPAVAASETPVAIAVPGPGLIAPRAASILAVDVRNSTKIAVVVPIHLRLRLPERQVRNHKNTIQKALQIPHRVGPPGR